MSAIISSGRAICGTRAVAQARPQLTAAARHRRDRVQPPGVEAERRGDDEPEADRVHHATPAEPDGAGQDRRDGRADDPGDVHQGGVQRHRVADQVAPDHLLDEGLPRRVVHRAEDAEQHREDDDLP
jgi:hypothetical protein